MSFRFIKTLPGAIAPTKAHFEDSGYDMVLISKVKRSGRLEYYDTGIAVQPPPGHYFEIYGRSSISKTGYMLANNVGIIDQNYRGSIIAALIKINMDAPDLELPCKLLQLIPRQYIHLEPIEVTELDTTDRGDGGFGSTSN